MATYSFLNCVAAIVGPGGAINLGNGAGAAEEGISYALEGDKDILTLGADGTAMHALVGAKGGEIVVRLLKVSPTNALLSGMYNLQTVSSALHGINTITIRDAARGDNITGRECAFRRLPANAFNRAGPVLEWAFTVGYLDVLLGTGSPEALRA